MSKYLNEEEMIEWFMNLEWDGRMESTHSMHYFIRGGNNDTDVVMDQSIYSEDAEDYLDVVELNKYYIIPFFLIPRDRYAYCGSKFTGTRSKGQMHDNSPDYIANIFHGQRWRCPKASNFPEAVEPKSNTLEGIDTSTYLSRPTDAGYLTSIYDILAHDRFDKIEYIKRNVLIERGIIAPKTRGEHLYTPLIKLNTVLYYTVCLVLFHNDQQIAGNYGKVQAVYYTGER